MRGCFINDQAAGKPSPAPDRQASPLSSPDRPLARPTGQSHNMTHTAEDRRVSGGSSSSSSSDSDRLLAAKRLRSTSLQRWSQPSDTDFASGADTPVDAPRQTGERLSHRAAAQGSQQRQCKNRDKRSKSRRRVSSKTKAGTLLLGLSVPQHGLGAITGKQQSTPDDAPSQTALQPTAHNQDTADGSDGVEDGGAEPDLDNGDKQEGGEGPGFEMPSQMPRELQSWAWDK